MDQADLREKVKLTYSKVADDPHAEHPFHVGRGVAEQAGYPAEWLARVPAASVDAFAGISCLPCFAEIPAEARVLDLGCGAGLDSLLTAPKAGSVVGVDFSAAMLAVARKSAESMGLVNVEFIQGDAESTPVKTGSIDVAVINGIFNLNPDRAEIFNELARVIRRGGMAFAAELVLKGPLPAGVETSESDWFSWIAGAKEGGAFLEEFRSAGFFEVSMVGRHVNPRSSNPYVEVARVRAQRWCVPMVAMAKLSGAGRIRIGQATPSAADEWGEGQLVICVPVTTEGLIDLRWGRANRVAITDVTDGTIVTWHEYDVRWDAQHDAGTEGSHHARVARFLQEHHVQAVVANHMGEPMAHMLERMGVKVWLGAVGDARGAVVQAIDSQP